MAKKQTRRSVSLTRELYLRAAVFSREHGAVPIAQLAAQGLEAILDGRLPLEPARDPQELASETRARRGQIASARDGVASRALVPREVFARMAAERRPRALPDAPAYKLLVIPDELRVDLEAAANRFGGTPTSLLETALHRLVDHLERLGHVWCRACLQDLGECRCKEPQTQAVAG